MHVVYRDSCDILRSSDSEIVTAIRSTTDCSCLRREVRVPSGLTHRLVAGGLFDFDRPRSGRLEP